METPLKSILTRSHITQMVNYISSHPEEFDDLIQLAISDMQPFAWRAAWALSNSISANDPRIRDHIYEILDCLKRATDSQKRSLMNILGKMKLSEDDEGRAFDISLDTWCKINKIASVRWSALSLAIKISAHHPELHEEIMTVTDDYYLETLSPGIKRSVQRMVKEYSGL